jgi:hypothetical protein
MQQSHKLGREQCAITKRTFSSTGMAAAALLGGKKKTYATPNPNGTFIYNAVLS